MILLSPSANSAAADLSEEDIYTHTALSCVSPLLFPYRVIVCKSCYTKLTVQTLSRVELLLNLVHKRALTLSGSLAFLK